VSGMANSETRIELNPKWVRGLVEGRTVVDSRDVKFVWTHPYYPSWFFPTADVKDSSLSTTTIEDLDAHVCVDWDAVDQWFEEDVEVFVHARDPHTRLDALQSSRHVRVSIDGTIVADSHRPTILFETGLPTRYYLPPSDVRLDLLTPTELSTACPYKGWANYWTADVAGTGRANIAWGYRTPLPESQPIAGLICFYNEKVDIEVDGEALGRPDSPFS
jgi:uncharacterized protein (DUF427 family)